MTYNIWGGGGNEGKSVDETVAVIRAADPDTIGVQETRLENDGCDADYCPATGESVAAAIADALGFYYFDQTTESVALSVGQCSYQSIPHWENNFKRPRGCH